jgi:Glycosyltransferase
MSTRLLRSAAENSSGSDKSSRSRPKILHVVSHLALGGAERVAVAVATSPGEIFDFAICAIRGIGDGPVGVSLRDEILAHRLPLHLGPRIPMRFGGVLTGAFTLARAIRATQPDLVHLHTEIPEASCAALLAMRPHLRRLRLVRTIHNSVIWHFWPLLGRWCDRRLAHAFIAGVSPAALSAFGALRQNSGAPAPSHPPALILNGLPAPCQWRPLDRSADTPLQIVFGGRFEREKGTDLIPAILQHAPPPAGRHAHLHLFGSGAHEPLLRALAQNPPPHWSVSLHAPMPDFAKNLHRYDALLLPSRHEGLALVAIEAALAGLPVVATDAPGLREVFPRNYPLIARTGDPAHIGRTLSLALARRDLAADAGQFAQAFARKNFDAPTMIQHYCDLYSRVLETVPSTL